MESDDGEYTCTMCTTDKSDTGFRASSMEEMRRHVAIDHCKGIFSTFRCGHCENKYYDYPDFSDHMKISQKCTPFKIEEQKLDGGEELAFTALVNQMARKLEASRPATAAVVTSPVTKTQECSSTSSSSSLSSFSSSKDEIMEVDKKAVVSNKGVVFIDLADDGDDKQDAEEQDNADDSPSPPAPATAKKSPSELLLLPEDPPAVRVVGGEPNSTSTPIPTPTLIQNGQKVMQKTSDDATSIIALEDRNNKSSVDTTTTTTTTAGIVVEDKSVQEGGTMLEENVVGEPLDVGGITTEVKQELDAGDHHSISISDGNTMVGGERDEESNYNGDDRQQPTECPPKSEKKLLDLCQLCVELQNGRPPIYELALKEAHAIIHLRFASTFDSMNEEDLRRRDEFGEVMKMCFQPAYYEDLKAQGPSTADIGEGSEEEQEW